METQQHEKTEARPVGRPALYRGKVRATISLWFTPEGHQLLQHHLQRTRMSRSDYFEDLMRKHGHRIPDAK